MAGGICFLGKDHKARGLEHKFVLWWLLEATRSKSSCQWGQDPGSRGALLRLLHIVCWQIVVLLWASAPLPQVFFLGVPICPPKDTHLIKAPSPLGPHFNLHLRPTYFTQVTF